MSYDPKCYELAEHFLPSGASERIKSGMAQAIQDAIEDYGVGETVNLAAQVNQPAQVFRRPECVFHYCPNPGLCQQACLANKGGDK